MSCPVVLVGTDLQGFLHKLRFILLECHLLNRLSLFNLIVSKLTVIFSYLFIFNLMIIALQ